MYAILATLALSSVSASRHNAKLNPKAVMPEGLYSSEDDVTMKMARVSFNQFKQQYNKVYENNADEEKHFKAYKHSLFRVITSGGAAGITKFSDLTPQEFSDQFLTLKMTEKVDERIKHYNRLETSCAACDRFNHINATDIPTEIDWVKLGAVTPVKNQGQCGSCWSFGTTGDLEGTHFLKTGKLISLSEQQLVSCDTRSNDHGCQGGLQEFAMTYIQEVGGLTSEKNYPYVSGEGYVPSCRKDKLDESVVEIEGWQYISTEASTEDKIMHALATSGPVTIALNANPMQDYSGGIDDPYWCMNYRFSLNHAVLIVGYGEEDGVKYWKIKNSWGPEWGEEGYYRIVRGVNKCGVAMHAVHSIPASTSSSMA